MTTSLVLFPVLYDRSAMTTTVLASAVTAENSIWSASWVALSGDGRRVD